MTTVGATSTGLAARLPSWMGSIRVRLTVLYSVLLFGLAALVVAGLYAGLARSLDDQPVSREFTVRTLVGRTPAGRPVVREETVRARIQDLERLVNQRALDQLRRYSFGALGLLFGASLVVGWVVAGRVLAPIGRITEVARRISATDLSGRIALTGPDDELRQLADTFDAMLARLDEAFESQRQFVQEASHELRNPLAVMRTNVEVALADPEAGADELRRTAAVVGRTAERMTRLVDDLLAHARRGLPVREPEVVDVAELAAEVGDEFAAPAEARGVDLNVAVAGDARVSGDRTALKQALANLVDNAVRLAPAGSQVRVTAGTEGDWAWLNVDDQGPGIPAEERELVFQRFWRAPGADGDQGRSGLGLTIVRQIADAHRGRVDLAEGPDGGSRFTVWLPRLDG